MPELPDVEVYKQYFNSTALHQTIKRVEVRNSKVLGDISAERLQAQLKGQEFQSTNRRGKYLGVETTNDRWLVLHFGMTGSLKYFKNPDQMPPHPRVLVDFDNGFHLAYDSQRMIGCVELVEDWGDFVKAQNLGVDPLDSDFNYSTFKQLLEGKSSYIKSALMSQDILAGLGNVYSDEILFQAGIHPKTKTDSLDGETLKAVFKSIQKVLQEAIASQADPQQFPNSYLLPHRHKGGDCPHCGEALQIIKVSGRTTYYCPNRQPQ
jgi:formamidopyrimidine-DNA glycosylase